MSRILRGILVLVLLLSVATAQIEAQGKGEEKSATPAVQYRALREKLKFRAPAAVALSDAERMKFVGRYYKHRRRISIQFVALAEKYPKDPVAVDALAQAVWHVNTRSWPVELVGRDKARRRAFELLERDHIRSEKLGSVCQRLT